MGKNVYKVDFGSTIINSQKLAWRSITLSLLIDQKTLVNPIYTQSVE